MCANAVLVILATLNRYISIPQITRSTSSREENSATVTELIRKVRAEAVLIAALLVCTAFLLHNMPAKHLSHAGHEHVRSIGK